MNIVHVNPHHTATITLRCTTCGGRCIAPSERELVAERNSGRITKHLYGTRQLRAWADLDAPAGTFYCTDCASDLDPEKVRAS